MEVKTDSTGWQQDRGFPREGGNKLLPSHFSRCNLPIAPLTPRPCSVAGSATLDRVPDGLSAPATLETGGLGERLAQHEQ